MLYLLRGVHEPWLGSPGGPAILTALQLHDAWRAMEDSNPRLRLRRPEGYPDYPNRPYLLPLTTPS